MRAFAVSWLASSVFIVNLHSLPSLPLSLVFLVSTLLLALRFPACRPWTGGLVLSVITMGSIFVQLANQQLRADEVLVDMMLKVRVISVPEKHERRLTFLAQIVSCETCQQDLKVRNIKLSWYGRYPEVRAGEQWALTARLKPPTAFRNPGGFDSVAYNLIKGIHARGYVRAEAGASKMSDHSGFALAAVRQQAAERLENISSKDNYLGLLQGLTVGIKTHISDEQWDVLRRTGTAHLLAISGLHVGLVAAWVLVAGRWAAAGSIRLWQRSSEVAITFDPRAWVLVASLLAAAAYAGLAGFELPTQRALLMLSVWVIAALRFRFLPPMSALCVALVVVLAINALNVLSAGFWLSFGTVTALFYMHRGHMRGHPAVSTTHWRARLQKLKALGKTHILLGVVLLPVSAWFFQAGSLVAPIANLIAVPWVAMVCVPLSLMGLLISTFSTTLAAVVISLATHSLEVLLVFLSALEFSVLSSVVVTVPGSVAFALVLIGLIVMLAPKGLGLRLLALPLFLPAVMHNTQTPVANGFEVHVLDVGQGLATLVYAGEQTLLFDTGGKVSPTLSMVEAVVVPFLQASGRRRIDTLVVSHGDEDHAFGVDDVVQRYPQVEVYASQPLDLPEQHPVTPCVAGDGWVEDIVQFGFLHPGVGDAGSDNNRSCVLLIHSGSSRVLLTGDIEASAEHTLLARLASVHGADTPFEVTLMTAPHHGSKSSSTQAFVDKLRPRYIVFPAGRGNRFGFPHSDVQLRYKLAGSKPFVTGVKGAVSFVFAPNGLVRPPDSWWNSHRRFWHGIVNPDCWQHFAGQSLLLRLHKLSQKGQTLCGK
ncbi:MAG: DNA internalization-related competence protein ComEC/Rec2 [Granulosicoccus sp.]